MKINYSLAIRAAIKAGAAITEVYGTDDFGVETKEDESPLTLADKMAHEIIVDVLGQTNIPILSEEGSHTPFEERSKWNHFWLVDPLDGTKDLITRKGR